MEALLADARVLLPYSLFYGMILSVALCTLILLSLYINPAMWLDDAPADLKAKVGPMSARTRRQRTLLTVPFFGIILAVLVVSLLQLRPITGGYLSFVVVFLHVFIVMMTFNVVDLLVIDWLIVGTIQPRFVIVPGTEGMAGYRDYGFHWRAFLKGAVGILLGSVVIAALVAGIGYLTAG